MHAGSARQIGVIGTTSRLVLGLILLALGVVGGRVTFIHGRLESGFSPLSLAMGFVALPLLVVTWQWLRARRSPTRLEATGTGATAVNLLVFLALVLTPLYVRPLSFTSAAALEFYGASMLLAAVRGYGGCEVLAASNWLLRRDDQIGCLVLSPIDHLERERG